MDHKDILKQAKKDLSSTENVLGQLHHTFGDTIPVDVNVEVSAANLAQMNKLITEYSNMKITMVEMMGANKVTAGELELEGLNLDLFKLGVTTSLDLTY